MSAPAIISSGTTAGGPPVGGSGTTNTIPRWTGATTLGDSGLIDNGTAIYTTTRNVGVGTTSPIKKATVAGGDLGLAYGQALCFTNAGTALYTADFAVKNTFSSPNDALQIQASGSSNGIITFHTGAPAATRAEAARIDSSGNVGINTTNPAAKVHSVIADGVTYSYGASGTTKGFRVEHSAIETRIVGVDNTLNASYQPLVLGGSTLGFNTNGTTRAVTIDSSGNVVVGSAAIATNATNGFPYVPSCAGTPTGTPTTYTGRVPIVVDTTNNKLYFYSGGAWRDAGP